MELNRLQKNITTGVPQGSTLGPLLFIICMNDLQHVSALFKPILFADDTSLNSVVSLFPAIDITETSIEINNELDKITDWLRANKLSLNTNKTKYMLFRYPQRPLNSLPLLQLKMNDIHIDRVEQFDFLGITISETLTWKPHTDLPFLRVDLEISVFSTLSLFFLRFWQYLRFLGIS